MAAGAGAAGVAVQGGAAADGRAGCGLEGGAGAAWACAQQEEQQLGVCHGQVLTENSDGKPKQ